jgi:hypothetical protein
MREKMNFKKSMFILITVIFLASIAGVCASDANGTIVAVDDANQIEVSSSDVMSEDNLGTNEENTAFAQADDGAVSAEGDSQTLGEGKGTF